MTLLNEVGCIGGGVGCKVIEDTNSLLSVKLPAVHPGLGENSGFKVEMWMLPAQGGDGVMDKDLNPAANSRNHSQCDCSSSLWLKGSMSSHSSRGLTPRSGLCWLHVLSHALIMCSLSAPDTRGPPKPFIWRSHGTVPALNALRWHWMRRKASPHSWDLAWCASCSLCPSWIQSYVLLILKVPRLLQGSLLLP